MVNYWDKYTEMHGQQNVKKYELYYSAQNTEVGGPPSELLMKKHL